MVSPEMIREKLACRLSKKRLEHTLHVAECAVSLSRRFGADEEKAYLAALLHDITKEESFENQLKICREHDIILDSLFLSSPQLLHPITGAAVARDMGADEEVCRAIYRHTLGDPEMSTLDKCVWLADLIEPGRDFPGVSDLRELAEKDLDAAVVAGMDRTVAYLREKGEEIHPGLIYARDGIINGRKL